MKATSMKGSGGVRIPDAMTMGHELLGVVEETGSAVSFVKRGNLVIVPFAFSDNTCLICEDGFQTACPHGGFFSGLLAELARIPQADGTLVVVPGVTEHDTRLLPSLLTLLDVYPTGIHAAPWAGSGPVTPSRSSVTARSACPRYGPRNKLGAERIILMGRHTARTGLGRDWGATDVIAERGDEGVQKVLDLTDGEGSHVVLEAVGHMPAYEQFVGVIRAGGIISRVGVPQ